MSICSLVYYTSSTRFVFGTPSHKEALCENGLLFWSWLVALVFAGITAAAHAQPSLKMMIPANPGGGWDQTGRNLATAMQSAKLVSSVQFDNKGGAGGTIGLAQFINSAKGDPNAVMIGGMVMVGAILFRRLAGES